jgi:uncharacterized membrane protein
MFGLLFMLLFWVGLIALAVWLISALFPRDGRRPTSPPGRDLSARQILDQRYAQGEITREQHELMKQDLG